jgi:toxin ParE1/3/4
LRPKPVKRRRRANEDIESAILFYLGEAGPDIAASFIERLEEATDHIAQRPGAGSERYGHQLRIPALRYWPMKRFPYIIFYTERKTFIEISRVLHSKMDIPSWLDTGDLDQA